jgi:hypothetical protein
MGEASVVEVPLNDNLHFIMIVVFVPKPSVQCNIIGNILA